MSNKPEKYKDDIERIYYEWDIALSNNDVEALLALYSEDTILESPLIPHLLPNHNGICQGRKELRKLVEIVAQRKPEIRKYYRSPYFTDGTTLIFEYPRATPTGEQMDFVEVMEIKQGLISHHRVYWGWRGLKVMQDDGYHRENEKC
jgi:hypothetical protein